jgi:hypothetical protein
MEKLSLMSEIKLYEELWSELLKVQFNDLDIDQLCYDIKHSSKYFGDLEEYLLDKAIKVKSNKITIRQFQDIIRDDIYKMRFKLRDIEDAENNITRKPFYPDKLIGKKILFKPYDAEKKEAYTFKILSIESHYPVKENGLDEDMVVYNISEDSEINKFPIRQNIIQKIIDKGTYASRFNIDFVTYELTYKIVDIKK